MKTLLAEITNPIINQDLGTGGGAEGGNILARLIVILWRTLMTLGGLAVILFFVLGAVRWLTAGGDSSKVEEARNTLTNAMIGMALVFGVMAFTNFIGPAIGFDLLALEFPTPGGSP